MRTSVIYVLPIFLIFVHKGFGLDCYQCDSAVDADCKEYFDWDHLDTLQVKPTPCSVDQAKYCIKTTGVWGGLVGTQRFCSSRDMFNQCQYVSFSDHNRVYRACIYTCSGDGCNTAVGMTSFSSVLLCASVLLALLVAYDRT